MKTLIKTRHMLVSLFIAGGILLLQSCAIYTQSREPVKVPDIVQMSKDGATSKDIINKIKKSRTEYTLKAADLSKLQKLGVSDSVINYMEQTRFNSAIRDAQNNYPYNYWGSGWGGYYYGYPYYGYPYYGWPYNNWGYWRRW